MRKKKETKMGERDKNGCKREERWKRDAGVCFPTQF